MNKPIKVKFFQNSTLEKIERHMNHFLEEEDVEVIDIKMHVDPQVDPDWDVYPCYLTMVMYK